MLSKKKTIILVATISALFNLSLFTNIYITHSKYVINTSKKAFAIEDIDKIPPTVTGVPDEDKPTKDDITVDYGDNDLVVSAKIWYNPTKKEFIKYN